jgi:hypothetical protein
VDWYEAYAEICGERQKAYLFCMRSMASGGAFHRAFPHEKIKRGQIKLTEAKSDSLSKKWGVEIPPGGGRRLLLGVLQRGIIPWIYRPRD